MRDAIKSLLKSALRRTPYRLSRGPSNRFDGIEEALDRLSRAGYVPELIIDGGAHLGSFSLLARDKFPRSRIHMIEPQPACRDALRNLAARKGFALSPVAIGARNGAGHLWSGSTPGTGASIAMQSAPGTQEIAVSTIDLIFADTVPDTTLLKLDLQGFELEALRGAEATLGAVEVILCEVSFYQQSYEPTPLELMIFLNARGFQLLDICALNARSRDDRLRQGDFLFARRGSRLLADTRWA